MVLPNKQVSFSTIHLLTAQEFIPRGRQAVEEHPGPLATKPQVRAPSEHLLLNRLQNVNISCDDSENECWTIQEIFKAVDDHTDTTSTRRESTNTTAGIGATNLSYINDIVVNSEEELYVKGCTAVWTRGIGGPEGILPRTSFTCESTIKHAFFCSPNFIRTDEPDKRKKFHSATPKPNESGSARGICLIGMPSQLSFHAMFNILLTYTFTVQILHRYVFTWTPAKTI